MPTVWHCHAWVVCDYAGIQDSFNSSAAQQSGQHLLHMGGIMSKVAAPIDDLIQLHTAAFVMLVLCCKARPPVCGCQARSECCVRMSMDPELGP